MPFLNNFKGELVSVTKDMWFTLEPLCYKDPKDGDIYEVPAAFTCDLASIPRLPLTWWLFKGSDTHRPGVLHDYQCRIKRMNRADADEQFYRALRCEGVNMAKARSMWLAVRAYSKSLELVGKA